MAVGKELEIIVKPFRSCPNENSNFFDDGLFLKTDKKSIGFRKSDEAWILFPDLFILSNLRHFDLSFFTFFTLNNFRCNFFSPKITREEVDDKIFPSQKKIRISRFRQKATFKKRC